MKDVLTTGEAAKYCGVNFRTVIRWIDKGYLEAYKLPGRGDNRIKKESLVQFMRDNGMPIPHELEGISAYRSDTSKIKDDDTEKSSDSIRRVLVVEDEDLMAKSIQRTLLRAGYTVEVASSGIEAGIALERFKPDIVTLDIQMPGMNGVQVLEVIRKSHPYKSLKVIIISANIEKFKEDLDLLGIQGQIEKPFKSDELITILKEM